MSAIEKLLETEINNAALGWAGIAAEKATLKTLRFYRIQFALDAALEYWLLKRDELLGTHDDAHFPVDPWNSKEGWICDCLDK